MITYQTHIKDISPSQLEGFFVGWPSPPDAEKLHAILSNSAFICLALDNDKVVGFVNAISDKVMSAYIPLLEVLPPYQGRGIGKRLILELEKQLSELYMIDICCDDNVAEFYQKLGYTKVNGMIKRNYKAL
jgi:ribosomal protein S18 acetylase RimI-like enzyme